MGRNEGESLEDAQASLQLCNAFLFFRHKAKWQFSNTTKKMKEKLLILRWKYLHFPAFSVHIFHSTTRGGKLPSTQIHPPTQTRLSPRSCPPFSSSSRSLMLFSFHPRNLFYYTNNFDSSAESRRQQKQKLLLSWHFVPKLILRFFARAGWQKRTGSVFTHRDDCHQPHVCFI